MKTHYLLRLLVTPTQRFSQAQAARELLLKLEQERGVDQGKA